MTDQTLPNLDVLDSEFLTLAGTAAGPWVSLFLPTHRTGRETLAARTQLANLLRLAEGALADAGHEAAPLLAPAWALTEQWEFWQNQADGLAVFVAPGVFRTFRLPLALPDEVAVGEHPRLRPLADFLSDAGSFYVLALSENAVRLLEGTRASIGELDLGDLVTAADDLPSDRDHQAHLQHSSQSRGGTRVGFHGHGADGSVDEASDERFFRQVAAGVDRVIGRTVAHPLVLATVEGNQSTYRRVSDHRGLLDDFLPGSPDRLTAEQLHERAWPLVEAATQASVAALDERYGAMAGTGLAGADIAEVAAAAAEGRVDTLLLAPASAPDGQANLIDDPVDAAIVATLRTGGEIAVVDDADAPAVRAIYRYAAAVPAGAATGSA